MKDVYLHDIPLGQAREKFETALEAAGLAGRLRAETVPLDEDALGRVLAEPVWARISSPHYHAAAMDGFALRAAATSGATPSSPVTIPLGQGAASYVDTGDPLPEWADSVVPIEDTEPLDAAGGIDSRRRSPAAIRVREALPPWKHVRAMGEDMVASELVLPEGHLLRPVDLGACAGSGSTSLEVAVRPRVGIIPSGSELKPVGQPVRAGEIIEYNSIMLAAQVRDWGGVALRRPIMPDDFDGLSRAVAEAAAEFDLVLLLSGSSAGSEDYSAAVIEKLGTLLVHGIAVRPGHPVILGMIDISTGRSVPIIGVPGYPVSAALTGEIFVEPLMRRWTGRSGGASRWMRAEMTRKITSPLGDDDYVRVALAVVGGRTLAAPISRGAGVISSMVRADGIVVIPAGQQGLPAGAPVDVRLYREPEEIRQTILAVGSHDMTLDLVAQHLPAFGRRLASANVGSLGGLLALSRAEAHLAGSHLLDPDSGDYNQAYIRKYLPGQPVVLVGFVGRQQGLMVRPGNPKGIHAFEDLARPEVQFVNRQRGAGTRVLLDYELEKRSIPSEQVQGYDYEEFTHLNVAAAVASGRADAGLGIPAAADALGLDFVALAKERYDLVIPAIHYESDLLAPLFELLGDQDFKKSVERLPGYDTETMGIIIARLE